MSQLDINSLKKTALESENRHPDLLFMKLHSSPMQLEESASVVVLTACDAKLKSFDEIELRLTIRFGEQEIKVPGGHIRFGLRGGELRLILKNGKLPIEKMKLYAILETEVEIETQQERGRTTEGNIALAGGVKAADSSKQSTKFKEKAYQVSTRGTEEEPIWVFEAKTNASILYGQLTQEPLGMVKFDGLPCSATLTFEIKGHTDVCITGARGVWAKDIHQNKLAIIERELFIRYIAPRLKPHISRQEGHL